MNLWKKSHRTSGISKQQASRAAVMRLPPAAIEPIQPYCAAAAGSMHKATITHIDPHMADRACITKKHQIAAGQSRRINLWPLQLGQFTRGAWQTQIQHVTEHIAHQSAAIKATFRRIAAIAIRNSHQANGTHQHGVGPGRIHWAGICAWCIGRRSVWPCRMAPAGRQQHAQDRNKQCR